MYPVETISIKGFKSIAEVKKLKLEAINIVIGPNGSGKSNFIGVFSFLHAIRRGRLQDYVIRAGGAEKVLYFGSKMTQNLNIHVDFEDSRNQYALELKPTNNDELVPTSETVFFWDKSRYPSPYGSYISGAEKEAGISLQANQGIAKHIREHLDRWRLYHFHDTSPSSPMKKTADVNDNRFLRPDASNLAAFLYYLRERHTTSYSLIRRTIQRVAPFFDDFLLEPQELNPDKIRLEWRHRNSEAYFDTSSLSDGTLRFIALATLFLQPDSHRPSVILVDEPELGLHPYAITMLASMIKHTTSKPVKSGWGKTQVILSTQSPLLLDQFEPENVLVADLVDGATQFTRLDSAKLATWLENYSLGELWEKNEFGGRPGGV
jgi:predicted ATPase